jgi:V/A-type H+-transporting ATPase subunit E
MAGSIIKMTLEKLKQEIEERSQEEIRQLKEKGESEVAEIMRETEEKSELIRNKLINSAKKTIEEEKIKLCYDASVEIKTRLNQEKEQVFESTFLEVSKDLADLRDKKSYNTTFIKLVEEAVKALGEEEIILHVDNRDEDLCNQVVQSLGLNCEIVTDLECAGGLNACTRDEEVKVYNTFESRLERAKEIMKLEIYATLYGD